MSNIKVSVIVPVYNNQKYLKKCINSLVNQSLKELEIILINDGSTDDSLSILNEYKLKYPNLITVLSIENSGASGARNKGLSIAKGDYISFVDSDDWIEKDMLTLMVKCSTETNSDIVTCDINYGTRFFKKRISTYQFNNSNAFSNPEIIALSDPSVCNKIFKRKLFDNVNFPIGITQEDLAIIPYILTTANRIHKVDRNFYNYRFRLGSVTTYDLFICPKRLFDTLNALDYMKNLFIKNNVLSIFKKEIEALYVFNFYMRLLSIPYAFKLSYNKKINIINSFLNILEIRYPNYTVNQYCSNLKNNKFIKHRFIDIFILNMYVRKKIKKLFDEETLKLGIIKILSK